MMCKFNMRLKVPFSSSMKGLAWTSLSQSPMSEAFTSSKMPPFNRLDDPLLMQPSITDQSLEVPSRDALRQLLVDSLSALPESRH